MSTQIGRLALSNLRIRPQSLLARLSGYLVIARQRQQLADLDPHQLSDIGLTADQAASEAARAPWDVPCHWRT